MVWYLRYYLTSYMKKSMKPIPQAVALKWYTRLRVLYFIFALNSLAVCYYMYKTNKEFIVNKDLSYAHYYARNTGVKNATLITYDKGFKIDDYNDKEYNKIYRAQCEKYRNSLIGKDIL